ncbi:unnamed protein product [Rotaria magnacalcarata]|uniref:phosphatidate phosphatase n=5 Tax=Rotaria magnacalcarata TaxID=392030 RepID=A0A816MIG6_9BILA|nr:unnamed protein product [Rotaria magnacalcarata]CAF2152462.1 unnamed protein product [Rotaria magnacalcarata]CAF4090669.1 unnamed protein product [Rotaria magnacalcarata]
MASWSGFVSTCKSAYNRINPCTLTGAIDVIVVKQEDETMRCTPFHVCFGKLSVLTNQQNNVYITINGRSIEHLSMKLGETGQALFITEEDTTTHCFPLNRDSELSNNNVFPEPDTVVLNNCNPQLSKIDFSPQIINKQFDEEKSSYENNEPIDHHEQSLKDLKQELEKMLFSNEHQLPRRQRLSTSISMDGTLSDNRNVSISSTRRHSVNENDLLLFQIDDEKQSSLSIPSKASNEIDHSDGYRSCLENSIDENENENDQRPTRLLSIPISIEPSSTKNDTSTITDESTFLINTTASQSAPITITDNHVSIQTHQTTSFYLGDSFSPTSSLEYPMSPPPNEQKSDAEYELGKLPEQSVTDNRKSSGWLWNWGELPKQTLSMFRKFSKTSSKQSTPQKEIHHNNIIDDKCDDRSSNVTTVNSPQNQPIVSNDNNPELGADNSSITQSPVQEYETVGLLDDVKLSLCGNADKLSSITDDLFNANLISYEKFASNPLIINDPNLVVCMCGKFYNGSAAVALMVSTVAYRKPLASEIVEKLSKKPITQSIVRTMSGINLWPFSRKNTNVKNENVPSVDKSEVIPPILQNQNLIQKETNDSEKEDHNGKKLIHTSRLKKTMILTSDQLKQLNLNEGVNTVAFSVTTAGQGTTIVEANIFVFDHKTKFVISDIDGTITKSDIIGHIFSLLGRDWSHDDIAQFFQAIQNNSYQFIYLSSRAIGQSRVTRNVLCSVEQSGFALPLGPLLISPDGLMAALYREVVVRRSEEFKIECLKSIASLFQGKNPFYAGFGNRYNDVVAYKAVGIPETRIFTINPSSEIARGAISEVYPTSYKSLHDIVDEIFPPMDSFSGSESYSAFTYWREQPAIDPFEDEMRRNLEDIKAREKSKGKGSTKQKKDVSRKT